MRAIILAGGFGTRLQTVVAQVPKPMAPIQNKPFLAYLLDYLKYAGFTEVCMALHHMHATIQDYFQDEYQGIKITYAIETEPLGTGGGIVYALQQIKTSGPVWVLNGDTFLKLNYRAMFAATPKEKQLAMALRKETASGRYGNVILQDKLVAQFQEKSESASSGYINAGVYLLQPTIFNAFNLAQKFSFEQDFLALHVAELQPYAYIADDYFIDIGIPADYARAQKELPALMLG